MFLFDDQMFYNGWITKELWQHGFWIWVVLIALQTLPWLLAQRCISIHSRIYYQSLYQQWTFLLPAWIALIISSYLFSGFWSLVSMLTIRQILHTKLLGDSDQFLKYYLLAFPWIYSLASYLDMCACDTLVICLLVVPIFILLRPNQENFYQRMSHAQWPIVSIAFLLGFMTWLAIDGSGHDPRIGKAGICLWLLFLIQLHSSIQHLFDQCIAKKPIFPTLRPKSSWQSLLLSAVAASCVSAFVGVDLTVLSWIEALGIGLSISLASFFGQIFLQNLCQCLGIMEFQGWLKDCNDTLGAFLFASPVSYVLLRIFY